jgi:hypothetical protein
MIRVLSCVWAVCAVLAGVMLGGCATYDVTVSLADSLKRPDGSLPPVQVDVIGIKESEKSQWQSYPVSKYFSGEDARRKDLSARGMKEMALGASRPSETLSKDDVLWKTWQKPEFIVVMANIPGYVGVPGGEDARRQILPTSRDFWGSSKINIHVESSRLSLDASTPMKTPK